MKGFGGWLCAGMVLISAGRAQADRGMFLLTDSAGKCVDVDGANERVNGAKVQVWDCHGKPNQQWYQQGPQIMSAASGRCLDVDGGNRFNGAKITVWDCNGGANQQWRWERGVLVNGAAGKCLDVDARAININGGRVSAWDCHGGANQQFQRRPVGVAQAPQPVPAPPVVYRPQPAPPVVYQPQPAPPVVYQPQPAPPARWGAVSLRSFNYPDRFVREWAFLAELAPISNPRDRRDGAFRIAQGLADPSAISFESVNTPGRFLRHQNFRVKIAPNDGTPLFAQDATFRQVPGLAARDQASFQSYNYPDRYLRHRDFHLWVEAGRDRMFPQDSTFTIVPAFGREAREQPPQYPPPDYVEQPRQPVPPPAPPPQRNCGTGADDPGCMQSRGGRWPMDADSFQGFLAATKGSFSDFSRRDMIIDVLSKNVVTARQFTTLLAGFNNDLVMMDVVRAGAVSVVDPMRALGYAARIRNEFTREEYTKILTSQ